MADDNTDATPAPEATPDSAPDDSTLDLDGARVALAKVRREAANWRIKHRELEASLSEHQARTADLDGLQADNKALAIENVALRHRLPDELRGLLNGDDRAELEAQAAKLAKYAAVPEPDFDPELNGGLDPHQGSDHYDPHARALEIRRQRGRI